MPKGSFVRISSLRWADILVGYTFFVLQNYLTDVWGLSFTNAAAILNFRGGIGLILPGLCLYLVDSFLGNFGMLVLASIAYTAGIGFIAISTPPVLGNATGMCKHYKSNCVGHSQKVLFYIGMALVVLGKSGNEVSLRSFVDEQTDEADEPFHKRSKWRKFGFIVVVVTAFTGTIALPTIKPWSIRFGIPAIFTASGMLLFLSGWCSYKKKPPQGSPLTNVCRVFVALATKTTQPSPIDAKIYHKEDGQEPHSFTHHTRFLRCMEKAAIDVNAEEQVKDRWKVCSIAEVEESKILVRIIPMWLTFIMCGIVSSIGNTYFIEQASHLNRKIGKWNVPLQILLLLKDFVKSIFDTLVDRFLWAPQKSAPPSVKKERVSGIPMAMMFLSTFSKRMFNELVKFFIPRSRDLALPEGKAVRVGRRPVIGIGVAMMLSVLCCITSAQIEKKRINVIRHHGLFDKPDNDIPMSVYWLLFQYFLLAGLDSFFQKSIVAFYACQAPETMRNYLVHFTKGASGLGFMFSVLTVYVVDQISEKGGRQSWFQFTLNRSRLDKYYWVLAVLSSVNMVIFILVASFYRYKKFEAADEHRVINLEDPEGNIDQVLEQYAAFTEPMDDDVVSQQDAESDAKAT